MTAWPLITTWLTVHKRLVSAVTYTLVLWIPVA
jgi:hypothetical protein